MFDDLFNLVSDSASSLFDGMGDVVDTAFKAVETVFDWGTDAIEGNFGDFSNWFDDMLGVGGDTYGTDTYDVDYGGSISDAASTATKMIEPAKQVTESKGLLDSISPETKVILGSVGKAYMDKKNQERQLKNALQAARISKKGYTPSGLKNINVG